jgi:regulatory protein
VTAIRLLAQREHSIQELWRKLHARGFDEQAIISILQRLSERGLQSDERYVESFVVNRTERGYGPLRIRAELLKRGIDAVLIDACLEDYKALWPSLMRRVHDRKFGTDSSANQKMLGKKMRFLQHRGFPMELIRQFLHD